MPKYIKPYIYFPTFRAIYIHIYIYTVTYTYNFTFGLGNKA
jgi:hypothetical protein